MITEKELLHYFGKQSRHTAGFKQLVHDLALKGHARRQLDELLREMTKKRKLVAIGKGRWGLPIAAQGQAKAAPPAVPRGGAEGLVSGSLRMHRDGYGFVIPEANSLPARARGKLQGDIFIPPSAIGNAMHGDDVLVDLGPVRPDGRAEGRIARVARRHHERLVGKFHYDTRHNYVTPLDERVGTTIIIPAGMERPRAADEERRPAAEDRDRRPPTAGRAGRSSPHRVLGDEVRRRAAGDLEGMVVEVEIIQWPSATQQPRGRVVEVLGHEDDFGVDVEIVIRKHHIRHVFPDEVLDEAQAASAVITQQEIARRKDYRDLPIVTIDGETARDFDDAVLVSRLPNGDYELQVHIADVAHYVEDGSDIDEEARLRGTSVYFPDRAVPMLPLELSTDICSLRPGVERLVLSCIMEIDPHAEIVSYELGESVICSAHRMTYTDVNAIIEGDESLRRRYGALSKNFDLMYELARILHRKRARRGSIDFDLPEPVIEFDDFGLMKSISPSERNWAHRLIEEFMLAANETVAGYLEQRVASLYRIHEKPDPKRVYEFESIAAGFGYSLGVGPLPVKRMQMRADKRPPHGGRDRRAPMIELPQEVHVTPRMYQKLTQKIAGKPEERILSYLMLRSLKQARYAEVNEGHFALAAPSYTHFTSPIRRYPDLIIHRILKAVLRESPAERTRLYAEPRGVSPWSKRDAKSVEGKRKAPPSVAGLSEENLHVIAESSSQTERAADDAERELLEWKKVKFMQERIGEEFDGLVVSVTKFGLFVELTELFVEGLVPIDTLSGDHYTFRENTRQIIGSRTRKAFSIGDKVRVLVDRIDPVQHKIQFAIAEEKPAIPRRHKKRR